MHPLASVYFDYTKSSLKVNEVVNEIEDSVFSYMEYKDSISLI